MAKLILSIALAASIYAAFTVAPSKPMVHGTKIMCIGDSITLGAGSPTDLAGYRSAFAAGYAHPVEFVGSQLRGRSQYAPCEGYPGKTSYQIERHVPGAMRSYHPDVVFLLAGINDIATNQGNEPVVVAATGIRRIISDVLAESPSCQVYVATLTPVYGHPQVPHSKWMLLNRQIALIARAAGPRVHCVDMSAARIASSDLRDGVHPLPPGYRKIASVWRASLSADQN